MRRGNEDAELKGRLEAIGAQNERLERELRTELARSRAETGQNAKIAREELTGNLSHFAQTLQNQLASSANVQNDRLSTLTQSNEQRLEAVRATVEQRLELLRTDNAQKLEQMRATVDNELHTTLEQRLGESFKLVSDRLEQVHKGLGEMQTLATGVGDFKRVLTNVKTRGTWGEVQLENLLEQIFIRDHYDKQVMLTPGSRDAVDFCIRLPDKSSKEGFIYLPIDAKFPIENYQRLVAAQEKADPAGTEAAMKDLANDFKREAKSIKEKYVVPPKTT